MKGRKIMKKSGFTLAEVLIVLGIIGVVAAMTIPTLMNQTSQAEYRTGFKKIISTLNQAINMNVAIDNTDFSSLGSSTCIIVTFLFLMISFPPLQVHSADLQHDSVLYCLLSVQSFHL